ncbi:hypothetical protein PHET_09867, partial [Paragonimus heterotremus]
DCLSGRAAVLSTPFLFSFVTCWNPYFGRTLSPGVSTLPHIWSEGVPDSQRVDSRLACYTNIMAWNEY